jgi:galactokinase/mevalonate kinase-like predicted kinase
VPSLLIETITSDDPALRDRSVDRLIAGLSTPELVAACDELEAFRRSTTNLYERVRASMFLHAIYRYRVQESPGLPGTGRIPFDGFVDLLQRRFEQAVARFRAAARGGMPDGAIASALAQAYAQVAYQTLADQVRRSVRSAAGNRWMFRVGAPEEHPMRLHPALLERDPRTGLFPILVERTPVRLDLSHSAWSDIFFLGMDYPKGARVLNISVDLGVHGRDPHPRPPIETFARVISEPVIRLTSLDLGDAKDVATLDELFNFGNDYLGLVKAGVIASGLVPPSFEGTGSTLEAILAHVVRLGHGLEVVSQVNDIPKGSRLAVSTNLLASLISLLMRATGQAANLVGSLRPDEARVVVARAILGEWLGGSGGGWQDSGGIFPGVKVIRGAAAGPEDPEWQVSRGRLLPEHELLPMGLSAPALIGPADDPGSPRPGASPDFAEALARSLVLVHGGMAQNVGPILNMVTEKYLLRRDAEWQARGEALRIFDAIVAAVRAADVRRIGALTTANWDGPLKRIIPWVSNAFTERLIAESRAALGDDFWGFLMFGGMSGGGMGFFVDPRRRAEFVGIIQAIMARAKADLDDALPFAMEPVVYDFAINPHGTQASLRSGDDAVLPSRYYALQVPRMIAAGAGVDASRRGDVHHFAERHGEPEELLRVFRATLHNLFPLVRHAAPRAAEWDRQAEAIKARNGFDPIQHAQLREDYRRGRIDLSRNRLPVDTDIQDVADADLLDAARADDRARARGEAALRRGEVAVVTLAAGVGSRWTTGAGVVKAVNPFVPLGGRHRSFLEIHLAKTRRSRRRFGADAPHVVTTSFLTHAAIERHLRRSGNYAHDGPVYLSPGQSIGHRLVPTARSLTFLWEETPHELLDENRQKVVEAGRRAILDWARAVGEATDYTDNLPLQRFNPPGHFYEVPNLLRNGVLARLLDEHPGLRWLMVHNIDTLGADLDPGALGLAIDSGATLGFEVVPRRIEDRGGGLARVNGRVRLLEGLAVPREDAEFRLRYYNTLTTWVNVDGLLSAFELSRSDLTSSPAKVAEAVRRMAARVPTYITIKDVKRRWGHGQEDVFPVAQFEKLWGDLTALPDLRCAFLAVDRRRGQQLKDAAQLDGWANDGSREYVQGLCEFPPD